MLAEYLNHAGDGTYFRALRDEHGSGKDDQLADPFGHCPELGEADSQDTEEEQSKGRGHRRCDQGPPTPVLERRCRRGRGAVLVLFPFGEGEEDRFIHLGLPLSFFSFS